MLWLAAVLLLRKFRDGLLLGNVLVRFRMLCFISESVDDEALFIARTQKLTALGLSKRLLTVGLNSRTTP